MKRPAYHQHTLDKARPVWLIGIGGAGMSVIAELLHERGFQVGGSDRSESQVLATLRRRGITACAGHSAEHLPDAAQVVISTAIPEDNPELMAARAQGFPIIHRSQALAQAAGDQQLITVAGAHGKTTTSAMLAWALSALGADPSYAVGADIPGMGPGAHLGGGKYFVAEADESDGSFLNYRPQISLVLNVEADHLDHYGDQFAFVRAFQDFVQLTGPEGTLVVCADDIGARELGGFAGERGIRVKSYGTSAAADYRVSTGSGQAYLYPRLREGEADGHILTSRPAPLAAPEGSVPLRLLIPGEHNELNATGAYAVLSELGFASDEIIAALESFPGAARRAQVKARIVLGGDTSDLAAEQPIQVIDDYAHHPTEVRATLHALQAHCPGAIRVIFQPHLFSRTATFAEQFAQALQVADDVIVTSVYPAREAPIPGVDGHLIAQAGQAPAARRADEQAVMDFIPDMREAAQAIAERAVPGDILLTMGAGDITTMGREIISQLRRRGGQILNEDTAGGAPADTGAQEEEHAPPR